MQVKEEPVEAPNSEMDDNAAPAYNPGDADQAHGDDGGDFGDGDVDMDDGGVGFDEDWDRGPNYLTWGTGQYTG